MTKALTNQVPGRQSKTAETVTNKLEIWENREESHRIKLDGS